MLTAIAIFPEQMPGELEPLNYPNVNSYLNTTNPNVSCVFIYLR